MNTDTTFELLSSPVRRGVVAVLRESTAVSRDRLVEALAADENDRRRLRIVLHHNHLPKLADADLITYDGETVAATKNLERVAHRLHGPDGDDGTPVLV